MQVGLGRERAVVLRETPEVAAQLHQLTRAAVSSAQVPEQVRPLLHTPAPRAEGNIAVTAFGHPAGDPIRRRLRAHLRAAGLNVGSGRARLTLVVGVGEPSRSVVDRLTRRGKAHLLVRFVEGEAVVGPLVVPGRTACLRCLDADATQQDPAWPLLVEQYAHASSHDRADGLTEPLDPMLTELVLAWVARDVITYCQDGQPSTWSTTLRFPPNLRDVEAAQWNPHPSCGCAWTMAP